MWFTEQRLPLNRKHYTFDLICFCCGGKFNWQRFFLLNLNLSFLMSEIQINYTLCFSWNDFIPSAAHSLASGVGGHFRKTLSSQVLPAGNIFVSLTTVSFICETIRVFIQLIKGLKGEHWHFLLLNLAPRRWI